MTVGAYPLFLLLLQQTEKRSFPHAPQRIILVNNILWSMP